MPFNTLRIDSFLKICFLKNIYLNFYLPLDLATNTKLQKKKKSKLLNNSFCI